MKGIALLFLLLGSTQAFAENKSLEEFFVNFKAGQYQKAIDSLNQLTSEQNSAANKYYLMALSYSRLQEYDKAKEMFEKALSENSDALDIHYEYGQALFANNNLKEARIEFKKSADKNFNRANSLYYVGHISQILEEYKTAIGAYQDALKSPNVDLKLEQIAKFQLAESGLSFLRQQNEKNAKDQSTFVITEKLTKEVDTKILPVLKTAYELDKTTTVSAEIDKRIKEIMKEFDLDPNLLRNGKRISPKRYSLSFDLKNKFDDNVTNSNLENDIQQSHKESFIAEAEIDMSYNFVLGKRVISTPEVRLNYNQYANQDDSEVYQNDAMLMSFSLNNKLEHLVKNAPASFIFNMDYSKTYKDYNKTHKKDAYATSTLFTFGEAASLFALGDTTFKFKYKNYDAYTSTLNNHTTSFSIDQTIALSPSQLLIILLQSDMVDNYNSTTSNTNAYMLRLDYVLPEIFPTYTLTTSLTTTFTDTLNQKATRGFESTLNPSVEINKDFNDHFKTSLSLDYTKNKSKASDYTYQKYVTTIELKYTF